MATTYVMQHYRAYSKYKRNPIWKNIVSKSEYDVEIYKDNLTKEEAINLEIEQIAFYKRYKDGGKLSNITIGGETVSDNLITTENDPKCSEKVYQYDLDGNFIKE